MQLIGHIFNRTDENPTKGSLSDLRRKIALLAAETDISKMAGYSPPSAPEIIGSAADLSRALENLAPQDKIEFISKSGNHEFRADMKWEAEKISDRSGPKKQFRCRQHL